MAHFLDASQLAEECAALGLHAEERALIDAAQRAAEAIARKRNIALVSEADNQPGFGGLCAGFGPAKPGQKCRGRFRDYDESSDWAEGAL